MIGPETRAEWKARTFMERYSAAMKAVPPYGTVTGRWVVKDPVIQPRPREDGKEDQ
jgi:hypothetical protein